MITMYFKNDYDYDYDYCNHIISDYRLQHDYSKFCNRDYDY